MKKKNLFCRGDVPVNKRRWLLYKLIHILERANTPQKYLGARMIDFGKSIREKCGDFESMFITGGVGLGKTHLMIALMKWEIEHKLLTREAIDLDFLYISVPELFLKIKDSYNGGYDTEKQLIDKFSNVDKLFLDDLGTARPTEWSLEVLYMIIDGLYKNNKKLVISSNCSLATLQDKYDQRIVSRIKEMCQIMVLTGDDRRLKAK